MESIILQYLLILLFMSEFVMKGKETKASPLLTEQRDPKSFEKDELQRIRTTTRITTQISMIEKNETVQIVSSYSEVTSNFSTLINVSVDTSNGTIRGRSFDREGQDDSLIEATNVTSSSANTPSTTLHPKLNLEFRAGPFGDSSDTDLKKPKDEPPTTTELTPSVFPMRGLGIAYGQACMYYGEHFTADQMNGLSTEAKIRLLSKSLCRINQRLECIPARVNLTRMTTPSEGGGPQGFRRRRRREVPPGIPGICRCSRGLSDRARYLQFNRGDQFSSACYIPAGFAQSSTCGHEVSLPYGLIDNGTLARKTVGNTQKMCVPNSECRTGYGYIGLRCACIKTADWDKETGECMVDYVGNFLPSPSLIGMFIGILVFILYF